MKRKPLVLQGYRCPFCDKWEMQAWNETVSSISMWNIVNQLGKHDFLGGLIFLVGRKQITWGSTGIT